MLLPVTLQLPALPFPPGLGANRGGLAAETLRLGPAGAGMCPSGGTLQASRRGPGLLVLASPPPSMMLILAVPSWEITALWRCRSRHPCPRLSSRELGSNLYLSLLLMRGCSGVEWLSGLFAQQRSELPPIKATLTFSLPRSKKKNALTTSMWWNGESGIHLIHP